MNHAARRRLLLASLVLATAWLTFGCALYYPGFGSELGAVPADQIAHPAADLNRGPLAAAITAANPGSPR